VKRVSYRPGGIRAVYEGAVCERMGNEAGSKWSMPVEVVLALVAMATEDAIEANKAGEADTKSVSCEPRRCTT
jgi:hypothetical protein